jgi:O-antigen/teichoic acid export membrane protein
MGFFATSIKGFTWISMLRGGIRATGFIRIAILARILTEAQFGLFGITTIVLSLFEIITETGINVFLIQEKDSLEKYIDTAWVISIVRGFLVSSVIIILTPAFASFFHAPEVTGLLYFNRSHPAYQGIHKPYEYSFSKRSGV